MGSTASVVGLGDGGRHPLTYLPVGDLSRVSDSLHATGSPLPPRSRPQTKTIQCLPSCLPRCCDPGRVHQSWRAPSAPPLRSPPCPLPASGSRAGVPFFRVPWGWAGTCIAVPSGLGAVPVTSGSVFGSSPRVVVTAVGQTKNRRGFVTVG